MHVWEDLKQIAAHFFALRFFSIFFHALGILCEDMKKIIMKNLNIDDAPMSEVMITII